MTRLLVLLLTPMLAIAAEPTTAPSIEIYQATAGDQALAMLASLFGGANGIFGPGSDAQIDSMFLALNVGILAVASAWFFYTVTSAVLAGSYDGEFLGRRYHSMWMPVRLTLGAAMLLPVWRGWNLAQLAMAYAASLGIGIANHAYTAMVEGAPPAAQIVAPVVPPLDSAAEGLIAGHDCVLDKRFNQLQQLKTYAKDDPALAVRWASQAGVENDAAVVRFGAIPAAEGYYETSCGKVRIPFPPIPKDRAAAVLASAARSAATQALAQLDADISRLYSQSADPDDPEQVTALRDSIAAGIPIALSRANQFQASLMKAAVAQAQMQANVQAEADKRTLGWLSAGGSYVRAAASQFAAAAAMPGPAEVMAPSPGLSGDRGFWQRTKDLFASAGDKISALGGCVADPAKCLREAIVKPLAAAGGAAGLLNLDGANPIGSLQALGSKLLVAALALFSAVLIIGAAATAAFGGAGLMLPITAFAFSVGIPLAALGLMLSIWPPLIIPIAWVFAVGSWLVIVIEALLAAPIWALLHLHPDGEGFAGDKTAHGYIFLLNLLFRPALLVITLVLAGRLLTTLGGWGVPLITGLLGAMATSTEANPFLGIVILLGSVFVVYKLCFQLISFCAGLLAVVPNQVFT